MKKFCEWLLWLEPMIKRYQKSEQQKQKEMLGFKFILNTKQFYYYYYLNFLRSLFIAFGTPRVCVPPFENHCNKTCLWSEVLGVDPSTPLYPPAPPRTNSLGTTYWPPLWGKGEKKHFRRKSRTCALTYLLGVSDPEGQVVEAEEPALIVLETRRKSKSKTLHHSCNTVFRGVVVNTRATVAESWVRFPEKSFLTTNLFSFVRVRRLWRKSTVWTS